MLRLRGQILFFFFWGKYDKATKKNSFRSRYQIIFHASIHWAGNKKWWISNGWLLTFYMGWSSTNRAKPCFFFAPFVQSGPFTKTWQYVFFLYPQLQAWPLGCFLKQIPRVLSGVIRPYGRTRSVYPHCTALLATPHKITHWGILLGLRQWLRPKHKLNLFVV